MIAHSLLRFELQQSRKPLKFSYMYLKYKLTQRFSVLHRILSLYITNHIKLHVNTKEIVLYFKNSRVNIFLFAMQLKKNLKKEVSPPLF